MDPVTVTATVARPRHEVFEYLADIANHPEFTDHFLVDWRLTREQSFGRGAGARFRIAGRGNRFSWADAVFTVVETPWRIVEEGPPAQVLGAPEQARTREFLRRVLPEA